MYLLHKRDIFKTIGNNECFMSKESPNMYTHAIQEGTTGQIGFTSHIL